MVRKPRRRSSPGYTYLPRRILVGDQWFDIRWKLHPGYRGMCGQAGYIDLAPDLRWNTPTKRRELRQVLWHEITHAVAYSVGTRVVSENFADVMAETVNSVLRRYPSIRRLVSGPGSGVVRNLPISPRVHYRPNRRLT